MRSSASDAERERERSVLAGRVLSALQRTGARWALQGPRDVVTRWARAPRSKDLDLWADRTDTGEIGAAMVSLGAIRILRTRRPGWLQHEVYALPGERTCALVDFTLGDLGVGPIVLCPASAIRWRTERDANRLTGIAAVADLLLRPLLRGSRPPSERVEEARREWRSVAAEDRKRWIGALTPALGRRLARHVEQVLEASSEVVGWTIALAQARLIAESLKTADAARALLRRVKRRMVPPGRPRPLGRAVSGLVVALIGTDGTGKSTVTDELAHRLRLHGYRVRTRYFGRARGNLPGVGLLRRLIEGRGGVPGGRAPGGTPAAQGRPPRPLPEALYRIASWYYVLEYPIRAFLTAWPYRAAGDVVILDRYVYDLQIMRGGSSRAARWAQALCPRPDLVALLDAPLGEIQARKPERTPEEADRHQTVFRRIVAARPGKLWSGALSTGAGTGDSAVKALVLQVLAGSHRRHDDPG